jgi:hypothetical protein
MSTRSLSTVAWLAKMAWLIFVAVIAIQGARYGYTKNGIGGCVLGFVIGILVGAMSATIWAFIFYFAFKIGRFILRALRPSVGKQQ